MRMREPRVLRRKCQDCEQEDEQMHRLQRKVSGSGGTAEAPGIIEETLAAPGTPLDPATRSFFEGRFDRDFSQVRVHADPKAAASASAVDARAYTVGNHIAFAAGEYNSSNNSGRLLLAHELAHIVQQNAVPQAPLRRDDKKAAAAPEITIAPLSGPTAKECDAFSWAINWVLNPKTEKGGWLIQHIDGKFDIKDCSGKKVDSVCGKWDYWEAWEFEKGQTTPTYKHMDATDATPGDDTFECDPTSGTKGQMTILGTANFFEGLKLPESFKKNNSATDAGILPSTKTNPSLTGGSKTVNHTITVSWDCCPPPGGSGTAASKDTKIVSTDPPAPKK
jgi:hypothetical protein